MHNNVNGPSDGLVGCLIDKLQLELNNYIQIYLTREQLQDLQDGKTVELNDGKVRIKGEGK
jgi:hypothetical protein